MNTKVTIQDPTTQAVTSSEMEEVLRLSGGQDSTTITRQIAAATRHVEQLLGRSLITRTITLTLDHWPKQQNGEVMIYLPYPPHVSITSFAYIDTAGESQTLVENTDFRFEKSGDSGRLVVAAGSAWPSVSSEREQVITVTYTAGYGTTAADVPEDIREGIVKAAMYLYTNGAVKQDVLDVILGPRIDYFDFHQND